MTLPEYLRSLTDTERDFIAGLDYGNGSELHRKELDVVIDNDGNINGVDDYWYPYEVIELGKNWLQEGHEREFAACAAIVLHNIITGADQNNDIDTSLDVVIRSLRRLDDNLRLILDPLLESALEAYEE